VTSTSSPKAAAEPPAGPRIGGNAVLGLLGLGFRRLRGIERRLSHLLHLLAIGRSPDAQEAEDVVHDALLVVVEAVVRGHRCMLPDGWKGLPKGILGRSFLPRAL